MDQDDKSKIRKRYEKVKTLAAQGSAGEKLNAARIKTEMETNYPWLTIDAQKAFESFAREFARGSRWRMP